MTGFVKKVNLEDHNMIIKRHAKLNFLLLSFYLGASNFRSAVLTNGKL